jgi:hypothetical protein
LLEVRNEVVGGVDFGLLGGIETDELDFEGYHFRVDIGDL